jgi:hypothetical protein
MLSPREWMERAAEIEREAASEPDAERRQVLLDTAAEFRRIGLHGGCQPDPTEQA